MSEIQQIYCTHCTYGNSAIERRDGEIASRPLGYSARSSSLSANNLRKSYRQIERFMYYYLPTDAPAEEKLRLDASTAPRRLTFCPSFSDVQLVGQISYRQMDTAGRPGSYFGHFLTGDRKTNPWSVLDCLRLWGAPWQEEDSSVLPFDLSALSDLESLHEGTQPKLDDELLRQFLTVEPGKPFRDPYQIVSDRWKGKPVSERADLLSSVLQGYLDLPVGANRRDSVLLVVEPSVAALLFYGVARMLPAALREEMSFSTYEPSPDRLLVAMAATTFHFPEATDLKPDLYRGRGWVRNTFLDKSSDRVKPAGAYARVMVERFVADGAGRFDLLIKGFEEAGASGARDLDDLAQTLEVVPTLLDPDVPLPETDWSPVAKRYLGEAVKQRLAREPSTSPLLQNVLGKTRQLFILELVATDATASSATPAINYLLENLPPNWLGRLVASERIAREFKVRRLVSYLERHRAFPENCDALWEEVTSPLPRGVPRPEPLLTEVLCLIREESLPALQPSVPPSQIDAFTLALIGVCNKFPSRVKPLGLLSAQIGSFSDKQLFAFLRQYAGYLSGYPQEETQLGGKLRDLLITLPKCSTDFESRLDLLRDWLEYFPDISWAENRLNHWTTIRRQLLALKGPTPTATSAAKKLTSKTPTIDYDDIGRRICEAISRAMPASECSDDGMGTSKMKCIKKIGTALLGNSDFLPGWMEYKMEMYFQNGAWSHYKMGQKGGKGWNFGGVSRTSIIIVAGVLAGVAGVAGIGWISRPDHGKQVAKDATERRSEQTKPSGTKQNGTKPTDTKSIGPKRIDTSPVANKPADTKPANTIPVDTKPVDSTPADNKPADSKPADAKPIDSTPADNKPVDTKPADTKPADTTPADTKPSKVEPGAPGISPPGPGTAVATAEGAKLPGDKPADGQPDVNDVAPVSPPRTGDITSVSAVSSLPPPSPAILNDVTISRLSKQPQGKPQLVLHGLAFVNQLPALERERFALAAIPNNDPRGTLGVYLKSPSGNVGSQLCEFHVEKNKLQFQWSPWPDEHVELQKELQRRLRTCVIEVKSTAGSYFSLLGSPVNLPALPFKGQTIEVGPEQFASTSCVTPDTGLFIGRGTLRVGDKQYAFDNGDEFANSCEIKELNDRFDAEKVTLQLTRYSDGVLKFALMVRERQEADINKDLIQQHLTTKNKKQRIESLIESLQNQSVDQRIETAGEIAKEIGAKEPGPKPVKRQVDPKNVKQFAQAATEYETDMANYDQQILSTIISPARAKVKALAQELGKLVSDKTQHVKDYRAAIEEKKKQPMQLSCYLLRMISDAPAPAIRLRAEVVVVGGPILTEK